MEQTRANLMGTAPAFMRNVFFDIDTQLDFVTPAGALYAPGAERIIAAVAQLNRHAGASGIVLNLDRPTPTRRMTPIRGNGHRIALPARWANTSRKPR